MTKTLGPIGLLSQIAALLLLAQVLHAAAATDGATGSSMPAVEIDVEGGPLADALLEIGRRFGVIVSFRPQWVEGLQAAPVRGRYALEDALAQALRGSSLGAEISPDRAVTLKRVARAEAEATRGVPRREAAVPAADAPPPSSGEPVVIPTQRVVIEGIADRGAGSSGEGFNASRRSASALIDAPRSEIPQAVSVVTRDMLLAAQARTQLDVLEFATGVNAFSYPWGFEPGAKTRGFPVEFFLMGLPSYSAALSMDAATVERVETLKGPSGVIGGFASADGRGGVVNIIRKVPSADQRWEATLHVDSQDGGTVRSTLDVGGGSGAVLWRLVGYGTQSQRSDAGYDPAHAAGVLGSARYGAEDLEVTLSLLQEHRRSVLPKQFDTRQYLGSGERPEMSVAEPTALVSTADGRSSSVFQKEIDAQWHLSANWNLRAQARQERVMTDATITGYDRQWGFAGVTRFVDKVDADAWRLSLRGELGTDLVRHRLSLATEGRATTFTTKNTSASWQLDPETFVPGQTPLPPVPTFGSLDLQDSPSVGTSERAWLVEDQVRAGNFTVRMALRFAHFCEQQFSQPYRDLSGRNWDAGVAYRTTPDITVYVGAQDSMEASSGAGVHDGNGLVATPSRSRQQQAGAKFDLLDGRMALTVEAYRMRQLNVLNVRADGLPVFTNGLSGTGAELELSGRASGALDLLAGINVIRTRALRSGPLGEEPFWSATPATPPRSMHLLAVHRLPDSLASGLSASLAFKARSGSWAAAPTQSFKGLHIPGGARLDVALTRRLRHWSFGAAVENLFNRKLYESTINSAQVALQRSRSIGFTLGYQD